MVAGASGGHSSKGAGKQHNPPAAVGCRGGAGQLCSTRETAAARGLPLRT